MKNKLYMAVLLLSLSFLTTGASAQEVQETYDSFQQQEENIIKYQKLIKEDWHNTKAHNDLGEVYLKLRRLEEAEKQFKEALETDRVYSLGPFLFGDIYTDAERYKDKISDFEKVIEQNNEFARSHNNLGAVRLGGEKTGVGPRGIQRGTKNQSGICSSSQWTRNGSRTARSTRQGH